MNAPLWLLERSVREPMIDMRKLTVGQREQANYALAAYGNVFFEIRFTKEGERQIRVISPADVTYLVSDKDAGEWVTA
jgi:hypothetical protein